jgi:hypothetical protein
MSRFYSDVEYIPFQNEVKDLLTKTVSSLA